MEAVIDGKLQLWTFNGFSCTENTKINIELVFKDCTFEFIK